MGDPGWVQREVSVLEARAFTALGSMSLTGESNAVVQCTLEKEMDVGDREHTDCFEVGTFICLSLLKLRNGTFLWSFRRYIWSR